MQVIPIKTRILRPPQDDLFEVLDVSLPKLRERDIVVVTSKIVSIGEGRCVPVGSLRAKRKLIESEADYLARFKETRRSMFSIKGHAIVGAAGIDDSNSGGHWTLWPGDPFASAKEIWSYLRRRHELTRMAVIITDSVSPPMRLGTLGISIGFFGIHPVQRHAGKPDLFGRKFKFSRSNLVDGLAASAVLIMGETSEQTPLAIVRDVPALRFCSYDTRHELLIRPRQDIYYPILKPIYDTTEKSKKNTVYAHRRRIA